MDRKENAMNKLTEWIKQRQVAAFFVLTYAVSWVLWLPYRGKR